MKKEWKPIEWIKSHLNHLNQDEKLALNIYKQIDKLQDVKYVKSGRYQSIETFEFKLDDVEYELTMKQYKKTVEFYLVSNKRHLEVSDDLLTKIFTKLY